MIPRGVYNINIHETASTQNPIRFSGSENKRNRDGLDFPLSPTKQWWAENTRRIPFETLPARGQELYNTVPVWWFAGGARGVGCFVENDLTNKKTKWPTAHTTYPKTGIPIYGLPLYSAYSSCYTFVIKRRRQRQWWWEDRFFSPRFLLLSY